MKRLGKAWRSATTRVIFSYGVLFALWALILLALIFWQASNYVGGEAERQLKERAQYFYLIEPAQLQNHLESMYSFDSLHINSYGLFNPNGAYIDGHIHQLPNGLEFDGKTRIYSIENGEGQHSSTRILAVKLVDGKMLLLARDAGVIDQIHALLWRALIWGLALTVIPGVLGGVLLSVRPLQRIRDLQTASEQVIAGHFNQRLPVSERGDELDMLAGIVNRMLDEIERLMHEVKSVGDNIAHDLRTPLTHLRAQLYRIHQQMPEGDARFAIIEQAVSETDELFARFSALLRIGELRDEQRREAFGAVDLREIMEQVYELYEPLAEEKSLQLSLEKCPCKPLQGDRQLLVEAFSNLLANAIKFTPDQGRVLIRMSNESHGLRVDVIDSGPGIDLEHRRSIFKRFYRADSSRSTPGFGLGLSIVDAIVRLHGFQVEAAEVASGACLTVRCWPAPADAADHLSASG